MSTYVPAPLRRQVIERASEHCEYCRFPQSVTLIAFEMEHIISEKHKLQGFGEAEVQGCLWGESG